MYLIQVAQHCDAMVTLVSGLSLLENVSWTALMTRSGEQVRLITALTRMVFAERHLEMYLTMKAEDCSHQRLALLVKQTSHVTMEHFS